MVLLEQFHQLFSKMDELLPIPGLKSDELCVLRIIIILMDEHNEYLLTKVSHGNAQNIFYWWT